MTMVTVCSVKGSPGVSTACVALAQAWPRPVCVAELDLAGGDLHHRLRRPDGDMPVPTSTLLHYATASRRGPVDVGAYTQPTAAGVDVLFGLDAAEKAGGLQGMLPGVAAGLAQSPVDVLADVGRLLPGSPLTPIVQTSGLLLVVVPGSTEGYVQARDRLAALPHQLGDRERQTRLAVAVVTKDRHGRDDVHSMDEMLQAAGLVNVAVLGFIADDPAAAARLGARSRDRRSKLARTCASIADAITQLLAQNHAAGRALPGSAQSYAARPSTGTRAAR